MERKYIFEATETQVLTLSKRRCALCYGLSGDLNEKRGQIAHLDKNPGNNDLDNLVFLCLDHHDKYDGRTSQSKNYKEGEIKNYRDLLYKHFQAQNISKKSWNEMQILYNYLNEYHCLFESLFIGREENAYSFIIEAYVRAEELVDAWLFSRFRCNDNEIQQYQDLIYDNIVKMLDNILNKYEYVAGGEFFFKWKDDQENNPKLGDIKKEMAEYIANIKIAWDKLKTFLA